MHNFLDDIDNFQEQTLKIFLDMGFDSFMLVFPNAEQNEKDIAIYVEGGFEISTKGNFKKVLAKKDPEGFFKGLKGLSRDRRPKVFPASEPRRDGSPKLIFDFASPLKGWCRRFFFVSGRAWEFDKGDLFDIRVPLMSTVPGI
ncbi:unnamed protein product [Ilex paraguariensis]|uniref:Uncharacterized protein n=1 Tax=Ilex paraguariensis TaxID=185542 RepID=A0ABC8QTD4_9AQUA